MDPVSSNPQDASRQHLQNLRNLRARTYLPDEQAPYHGISHPDRVWESAQVVAKRCAELGIHVDGDALRNAIELHDALSHVPPQFLGFDSPERVAATLTFRFLLSCGYSETSAGQIRDIVMATNPEVRPSTTEEIIIRAADLGNLGASYREFRESSLALHQEAQIAKRAEIDFSHWLQNGFLYLSKFLWPMLELTLQARDNEGRSVFHTSALRNMATLWREPLGEETEVRAEFFTDGSLAPKITGSKQFYIAIHPDESARRASLDSLKKEASAHKGVAFAVPGERGRFPLPDEICSEVKCHDSSYESFLESLRVTKPGGSVIMNIPSEVDPRILETVKSLRSAILDCSPEGDGERALIVFKEAFI